MWDIIAPRPAAAAPIASAAVAVASCVLPPLDYAEVRGPHSQLAVTMIL